jgi:surface protein
LNAKFVPRLLFLSRAGMVTTMSGMFQGCSNFTGGQVAEFDVGSVADMSFMFKDAALFDQKNLTGWNTENVLTMESMFENCKNFTGDVSTWNVSRVQSFVNTFLGCSNFTSDIRQWVPANVSKFDQMLLGASNFSHDLCMWRDRLSKTNLYPTTTIMFGNTKCPAQGQPIFPVPWAPEKSGPWCYDCPGQPASANTSRAARLFHQMCTIVTAFSIALATWMVAR